MKNILKIGIMAGLIIAVLLLSLSCFTTSTPAGSTNGTGSEGEQSTFSSLWPMLVIIVVFFVFIYFTMIRPQRKRQKEHEHMMQELQKGDKVITAGGIFGTVESVREDSIIIKVESGATMRVNKGSIALRRDDTMK